MKKLYILLAIGLVLCSVTYASEYDNGGKVKLKDKIDIEIKDTGFFSFLNFPKVEKNKVTYENILTDIDIIYTEGDNYVKEDIILKKKPKIDKISFKLNLKDELYSYGNNQIMIHDKHNPFIIKGRFEKPFYSIDGIKYYLNTTYDGETYTIDIKELKRLGNNQFPLTIDPTYYEEYQNITDSNGFYVVITATSLKEEAFNQNDAHIVEYNPNTWILYSRITDYETSRSIVYETLYLGQQTDNGYIPEHTTYGSIITNVTGLTSIETIEPRDIGKIAYYAQITDGYFDEGTATAYFLWNFTDTTNNVNCSVWSNLYTTHGTAYSYFPNASTQLNANDNNEIGTDRSSDEFDNPKGIRATIKRAGTTNGGNRNAFMFILTKSNMTDWTDYIIMAVSNATTENTSFYETYSIPRLTLFNGTFAIPSTMNTAEISPSKAIDSTNLLAYCNGTSFNNSLNLTYYYRWYKNDTLYSSGNTYPNNYTSSLKIHIDTLSNTLTTPTETWLFSCLASVDNYNSSWLNSSEITIYSDYLNVSILMNDTFITEISTYLNKTGTTTANNPFLMNKNYYLDGETVYLSSDIESINIEQSFTMNYNSNSQEINLTPFSIDNCSNYIGSPTSATSYVFRFYDIETNNQIAVNTYGVLTHTLSNYSYYMTGTNNLSFCTYPNYFQPYVNGNIYYGASGYGTRFYTFSDTLFSNTTQYIDLYLLNISSPNRGRLIVEVYDDFSNLISGANVKLLEFSPATQSFNEIAQCYSDTNGECIFDVEINTKFYITTATATIDDQVYSAQSTNTGQLVSLDGTTIALHLKLLTGYTVDDLFNLVITPSNTTLIGNTSYLTATFNDASNIEHEVCVGYFVSNGLNEIEQSSNCITGSSGIVNAVGGYTLDRDFNWIGKIYVLQDDGTKKIYNSYQYPALESSFFETFKIYLKPILLMILLALLALALYLKNMSVFAIGEMIISPATVWIYPGLIGGVTMSFLIILGLLMLFLSSRKEEVS